MEYPGTELKAFEQALHWKAYLREKIGPYIRGAVLEVGAGIGGTTKVFNDGSAGSWTALEPDPKMYAGLLQDLAQFPANMMVLPGSLKDLEGNRYDTILYIDVLEHIEADKMELTLAMQALNAGGHLVILSPAFNFLFSPFDKAIGHFRRYRKQDIARIMPGQMLPVKQEYLDTMGFMAALANKLFLRQHSPSSKQVLFWDRKLVPLSRFLDRFLLHRFGKSVLSVWVKK